MSQLQEQSLCSLVPVEGAEEGADVGVVRPDDEGLSAVIGLIDLRKSVYAVGGVIGVFKVSSSLLMKSA
jgi:hypothetical protein